MALEIAIPQRSEIVPGAIATIREWGWPAGVFVTETAKESAAREKQRRSVSKSQGSETDDRDSERPDAV
jgi:hypothetical protein